MSSRKKINLDFVEIGARIRSLRDGRKITEEDLAGRLGLKHKSSIAKIENGMQRPTAEQLALLAGIFEQSVDFILTGKYGGERVRYEIAEPQDILKDLDYTDKQIVAEMIDLLTDTDSDVRSHLKGQIRILKRKSIPAKRRRAGEN